MSSTGWIRYDSESWWLACVFCCFALLSLCAELFLFLSSATMYYVFHSGWQLSYRKSAVGFRHIATHLKYSRPQPKTKPRQFGMFGIRGSSDSYSELGSPRHSAATEMSSRMNSSSLSERRRRDDELVSDFLRTKLSPVQLTWLRRALEKYSPPSKLLIEHVLYLALMDCCFLSCLIMLFYPPVLFKDPYGYYERGNSDNHRRKGLPSCHWLGPTTRWAELSVVGWYTFIGVSLMTVVSRRVRNTLSVGQIKRTIVSHHFLVWGVAFICVFVPLVLHRHWRPMHMFFSNTLWSAGEQKPKHSLRFACWLSRRWDAWSFCTFFLPLMVYFTVQLVIVVYSLRTLWKMKFPGSRTARAAGIGRSAGLNRTKIAREPHYIHHNDRAYLPPMSRRTTADTYPHTLSNTVSAFKDQASLNSMGSHSQSDNDLDHSHIDSRGTRSDTVDTNSTVVSVSIILGSEISHSKPKPSVNDRYRGRPESLTSISDSARVYRSPHDDYVEFADDERRSGVSGFSSKGDKSGRQRDSSERNPYWSNKEGKNAKSPKRSTMKRKKRKKKKKRKQRRQQGRTSMRQQIILRMVFLLCSALCAFAVPLLVELARVTVNNDGRDTVPYWLLMCHHITVGIRGLINAAVWASTKSFVPFWVNLWMMRLVRQFNRDYDSAVEQGELRGTVDYLNPRQPTVVHGSIIGSEKYTGQKSLGSIVTSSRIPIETVKKPSQGSGPLSFIGFGFGGKDSGVSQMGAASDGSAATSHASKADHSRLVQQPLLSAEPGGRPSHITARLSSVVLSTDIEDMSQSDEEEFDYENDDENSMDENDDEQFCDSDHPFVFGGTLLQTPTMTTTPLHRPGFRTLKAADRRGIEEPLSDEDSEFESMTYSGTHTATHTNPYGHSDSLRYFDAAEPAAGIADGSPVGTDLRTRIIDNGSDFLQRTFSSMFGSGIGSRRTTTVTGPPVSEADTSTSQTVRTAATDQPSTDSPSIQAPLIRSRVSRTAEMRAASRIEHASPPPLLPLQSTTMNQSLISWQSLSGDTEMGSLSRSMANEHLQ